MDDGVKRDLIDILYVVLVGIACPFALLIPGVIPNHDDERKDVVEDDA